MDNPSFNDVSVEHVTTCKRCGGYKLSTNNAGIMSRMRSRRLVWILLVTSAFTVITYKLQSCIVNEETAFSDSPQIVSQEYSSNTEIKRTIYNRSMPLIFIGGVPRSGTTLMRVMLDSHPDIRCGQETRVIPRIIQMRQQWMKSAREQVRLKEAGITTEILDTAVAAFVLEIITRHGEPAPRLCNKDPLTMKASDYMAQLFPNAKFIFMIRDGRAVVHSIITRKVSITGFDTTNYAQCMRKWNDAIKVMHSKCKKVGPQRCMMVYYEQLVLHPKKWLVEILKFLNIKWDEAVLHHEHHINQPGGVVLSKVEKSSDQVIKPVNLDALTTWVTDFPRDTLERLDKIAPMLKELGYEGTKIPPNYGSPDAYVYNNTQEIRKNSSAWDEKVADLLSMQEKEENNDRFEVAL